VPAGDARGAVPGAAKRGPPVSGFIFAHGQCVACCTFLSFNPHRVPSLVVEGTREPLCRGCFDRWNKIHRLEQGLEPIAIHPDAYQPCEE
jgi:hypothetical protein